MDVLKSIQQKFNSENRLNATTVYNRKRIYTNYAAAGLSFAKKIRSSAMLSDSPVPQTMKGQELEEEMAKISTMARKTRTANLKKLVFPLKIPESLVSHHKEQEDQQIKT